MYTIRRYLCTGTTVDGNSLFEDFDNHLCRTKMAIKTDLPFKNKISGHLVAFYGDYKQKFEDLAKLIGFEVIEER